MYIWIVLSLFAFTPAVGAHAFDICATNLLTRPCDPEINPPDFSDDTCFIDLISTDYYMEYHLRYRQEAGTYVGMHRQYFGGGKVEMGEVCPTPSPAP